ncbi:hypothetical protein MBAV_001001, partial [Candidatus Magnetobacterium bavaricum]
VEGKADTLLKERTERLYPTGAASCVPTTTGLEGAVDITPAAEVVEAAAEEVSSEPIETVAEEISSEPVEAATEEVVSEPVEPAAEDVSSEPVEAAEEEAVSEPVETAAEDVRNEDHVQGDHTHNEGY